MSITDRWWDTSLVLWILAKLTIPFVESLHFLKHEICLAPPWKINLPWWIYLFSKFPMEIFEFSVNLRFKIGWPPWHLHRVFMSVWSTLFKSAGIWTPSIYTAYNKKRIFYFHTLLIPSQEHFLKNLTWFSS